MNWKIPIIVCSILLAVALVIMIKDSDDPYDDGYEIAQYEVTYQLTGERDTIIIKTAKNTVISFERNNFGQSYISHTIDNLTPQAMFINDNIYYSLDGVGVVKKLKILEMHNDKEH